MKKQKNPVINKELYKHYLIDEIETLRKENTVLKELLYKLQKDDIMKLQKPQIRDVNECLKVSDTTTKQY